MLLNHINWRAKSFISASCWFPLPVWGRVGTWKMKRGCQNFGRRCWQSVLTALVSPCVVSKTTASPKRSSGQLVIAKSAVREDFSRCSTSSI